MLQLNLYANKLEIARVYPCKYPDIMVSTKNCDIDMKRKMRKFYTNINVLSRKFSKCFPDVKCMLFKWFGSNMYCSTMWYNYTITAMTQLRLSYNSLRRLMNLPKHNSAIEMCVNLNINLFDKLIRNIIHSFRNRPHYSKNLLLSSIKAQYLCTLIFGLGGLIS